MAAPSAILPYLTPTETSSELQLREAEGSTRIIFGVWPMWTYALAIAGNSVLALLQLLVLYYLSRVIVVLLQMAPPNALQSVGNAWGVFAVAVLFRFGIAILYGSVALAQWYRLYRWGRVPRRITATSSGFVVSQMGWLRPRHRFWAADQITAIELKPATGGLSKRMVATLVIRCRRWIPLRFRLSSTDPQLLIHIAERLAAIVGCRLTIR